MKRTWKTYEVDFEQRITTTVTVKARSVDEAIAKAYKKTDETEVCEDNEWEMCNWREMNKGAIVGGR
jgi:hypothetical protein